MHSGHPLCVMALEAFATAYGHLIVRPMAVTVRPVSLLRALRHLMAIIVATRCAVMAANSDGMTRLSVAIPRTIVPSMVHIIAIWVLCDRACALITPLLAIISILQPDLDWDHLPYIGMADDRMAIRMIAVSIYGIGLCPAIMHVVILWFARVYSPAHRYILLPFCAMHREYSNALRA